MRFGQSLPMPRPRGREPRVAFNRRLMVSEGGDAGGLVQQSAKVRTLQQILAIAAS